MKIKLTIDLPLGTEHGTKAGSVFEVTRRPASNKFVVTGAAGVAFTVFDHECEVVDATNAPEVEPPPAPPPPKPEETVAPVNDEEKLKLAIRAVDHVLVRIRDDKDVRYLLGYGTESFSRLVKASAAYHGKSLKEVEETVLGDEPGSS